MSDEPAPGRVIKRLLSKIEVSESGCWISLYSTGSHGYSQIGWQVGEKITMRLGHRVSWEAANGPIPEGLTIEHKCRVRRCINPEHMELMSNLDNAAGGGGIHTGTPTPTGRKCGKGLHDLLLYPSGAVACRECQSARNRRKYPNRVKSRIARGVDPYR